MRTATTPVNPWDSGGDANPWGAEQTTAGTTGFRAAPAVPTAPTAPPQQPDAPPAATAPTYAKPAPASTDPMGGAPQVTSITTLPDGEGGSVAVPPANLVHGASPVNPWSPEPISAPAAPVYQPYQPPVGGVPTSAFSPSAPMDATPWSTTLPPAVLPSPNAGAAAADAPPAFTAPQQTPVPSGALDATPWASPAPLLQSPASTPAAPASAPAMTPPSMSAPGTTPPPMTPQELLPTTPQSTPSNLTPTPTSSVPTTPQAAPWSPPALAPSAPSTSVASAPTSVPAAGTPAPWNPTTGGTSAPQSFTADNNSIGSVIAPWNPTGYGQQATISTAPSAQLQSLQAMQKAQLDKINNGPDRYAMAKQQYDNFTNATAGDYQREQQDALNRAGEHGYLRSGQLTNAYGDLAQRRAAQVDSARNNFLGNALEGTISDNRANLGAVTGIADSTYSQDAGIRAEQERQQATANNLVDRTNAQGANVRDEQRTERGYQNQLAQQAIAERVRQQQAEYQQQMDAEAQAERLYRLGQSGDPQQAYMQGARTYGNDAANSGASVAALMKLYAQRQNPAAAGGY